MKNSLIALTSSAAVVFALVGWNAWPTQAQDPAQQIGDDDSPLLDRSAVDAPSDELRDDGPDLAPLLKPELRRDNQPGLNRTFREPGRNAPTRKRQPSREIRVFALRGAKADDVIEILENFVEKDTLRMQPDKRTNALIVEGAPELIAALEKLIERIDPPTQVLPATQYNRGVVYRSGSPMGQPGPAHLPGLHLALPGVQSDPALAKLTKEYKDISAKVVELVREHRAAEGDDEREQLKKQIIELTNLQFDLRQKSREAEVERLKKRLGEVEGSVRKRNELKEQIVEKRVADILNEPDELQWESLSQTTRPFSQITTVDGAVHTPRKPVASPNNPGYVVRVVPRQITETVVGPDGKVREIKKTVHVTERVEAGVGGLAPGSDVQLPMRNPPPQPVLSEPDSAQRAAPSATIQSKMSVAEAEIRLRITEQKLATANKLNPDFNNGSRNELAIKRAELQGELELAKLQLSEAKRAYEATERLLKLDVQTAQSNLESAQAVHDEAEAVNKRARGSVPQSQMRRLKAKAEQARLAVERANALFELHLKSRARAVDTDATNPSNRVPLPATPIR